MTEQCNNFEFSILENVCRICLGRNVLRPMYTEEINWFQNVVNRMAIQSSEYKLNICLTCGHLLRKYMRFYQYCQNVQVILNQAIVQDPKSDLIFTDKPLHNFIKTKTSSHNFESKSHLLSDSNNYEVQNDIFYNDDDDGIVCDDDDMPLVMLSKSNDGVKENRKVKKKRKKIMREENESHDPSLAQETNGSAQEARTHKKRGKTGREGFSSRMVQETDEYVVIKLTKEQVLEEMRSRSQSEKYLRALYKCARCVQGFNFQDVLAAHMDKHTQENGSFECDMCSQYCPSAVSLRGHIKSHTTRYKCKICGVVRRGRQHLLEHHALTHTRDAHQYSCHHCQFTTNKRTVIQRHVRTHRASERHACHECGRLFQTVESLRVHTTRHDKSRSLRCGECGRSFLYPSLLDRHTRSVHQRTEYYCVECDARFKSPDNLRLHFKKAKRHRDSSSYTYECPQCSEKFLSAASLAVHSTTAHGQPKRYACEMCRRLYSSRESLRAHVRRAHKNAAENDNNVHS